MKIIKRIVVGFCFVVVVPVVMIYITVEYMYEAAKIIIFNKYCDPMFEIMGIMILSICFIFVTPIVGIYYSIKWLYEMCKKIIFNKDGFVETVFKFMEL